MLCCVLWRTGVTNRRRAALRTARAGVQSQWVVGDGRDGLVHTTGGCAWPLVKWLKWRSEAIGKRERLSNSATAAPKSLSPTSSVTAACASPRRVPTSLSSPRPSVSICLLAAIAAAFCYWYGRGTHTPPSFGSLQCTTTLLGGLASGHRALLFPSTAVVHRRKHKSQARSQSSVRPQTSPSSTQHPHPPKLQRPPASPPAAAAPTSARQTRPR